MPFIRHRTRSVQESMFQDLQDTLIACRWMAGTTRHEVWNPDNDTWQIVTRASTDVYALSDGYPVTLLDYFPDAGEITSPNTLAVDVPQPGEPEYVELGSDLAEQPYLFTFALYASSDAAAVAIMDDLSARYQGRLVRPEYIELFDFAVDPDAVVGRIDIDVFRFARDLKAAVPQDLHLYYCELEATDYLES